MWRGVILREIDVTLRRVNWHSITNHVCSPFGYPVSFPHIYFKNAYMYIKVLFFPKQNTQSLIHLSNVLSEPGIVGDVQFPQSGMLDNLWLSFVVSLQCGYIFHLKFSWVYLFQLSFNFCMLVPFFLIYLNWDITDT